MATTSHNKLRSRGATHPPVSRPSNRIPWSPYPRRVYSTSRVWVRSWGLASRRRSWIGVSGRPTPFLREPPSRWNSKPRSNFRWWRWVPTASSRVLCLGCWLTSARSASSPPRSTRSCSPSHSVQGVPSLLASSSCIIGALTMRLRWASRWPTTCALEARRVTSSISRWCRVRSRTTTQPNPWWCIWVVYSYRTRTSEREGIQYQYN